MGDRSNEIMSMLDAELNRRYPVRITGGPNARGWIQRLVQAGIEFGEGEHTGAAWDRVCEVMAQAEAFFAAEQLTDDKA